MIGYFVTATGMVTKAFNHQNLYAHIAVVMRLYLSKNHNLMVLFTFFNFLSYVIYTLKFLDYPKGKFILIEYPLYQPLIFTLQIFFCL